MRILMSIKRNPLNLVLMIGVAGFYFLNNVYFKHVAKGLLRQFLICYFNDLICPLFFFAYANTLLITVHRELTKLWQLFVVSLCAGLVWEYFAPYIKENSVSDLWDIVCYQTGTCVYWGLLRCSNRIRERGKDNAAA